MFFYSIEKSVKYNHCITMFYCLFSNIFRLLEKVEKKSSWRLIFNRKKKVSPLDLTCRGKFSILKSKITWQC